MPPVTLQSSPSIPLSPVAGRNGPSPSLSVPNTPSSHGTATLTINTSSGPVRQSYTTPPNRLPTPTGWNGATAQQRSLWGFPLPKIWQQCNLATTLICTLLMVIVAYLLLGPQTLATKLAEWSARKDFRDSCKELNQTRDVLSRECQVALRKQLPPPPGSRFVERTFNATWGISLPLELGFETPPSFRSNFVVITVVVTCAIIGWKLKSWIGTAGWWRRYELDGSTRDIRSWVPNSVARSIALTGNSGLPKRQTGGSSSTSANTPWLQSGLRYRRKVNLADGIKDEACTNLETSAEVKENCQDTYETFQLVEFAKEEDGAKWRTGFKSFTSGDGLAIDMRRQGKGENMLEDYELGDSLKDVDGSDWKPVVKSFTSMTERFPSMKDENSRYPLDEDQTCPADDGLGAQADLDTDPERRSRRKRKSRPPLKRPVFHNLDESVKAATDAIKFYASLLCQISGQSFEFCHYRSCAREDALGQVGNLNVTNVATWVMPIDCAVDLRDMENSALPDSLKIYLKPHLPESRDPRKLISSWEWNIFPSPTVVSRFTTSALGENMIPEFEVQLFDELKREKTLVHPLPPVFESLTFLGFEGDPRVLVLVKSLDDTALSKLAVALDASCIPPGPSRALSPSRGQREPMDLLRYSNGRQYGERRILTEDLYFLSGFHSASGSSFGSRLYRVKSPNVSYWQGFASIWHSYEICRKPIGTPHQISSTMPVSLYSLFLLGWTPFRVSKSLGWFERHSGPPHSKHYP